MNHRKTFLAASLLVACLAFLSSAAKSNTNPPAKPKAKVIVQEMKISDDNRRLLIPTKVEAKVNSIVTAEVEGLITKILKPLGSRVRSGEVVLYVENKDPAFTYAKVPVRSPVSGVVSQINSALMSKVSRGDRLFVVMDPRELKLTAEVPAGDLEFFQPGAKGEFKQSLDQEKGAPIQVVGISPLVDPRTGTASAELAFVKDKSTILPSVGMVGHALFEMNKGKVLLIPEAALGYSEGKPTVKVLDGAGLVKRIPVELGEQKESQLVIKSGLSSGDKLIVRANRNIKEGEAVDVEPTTN